MGGAVGEGVYLGAGGELMARKTKAATPEAPVVAGPSKAEKAKAAAIFLDPALLVPWDQNPRVNDEVVEGLAKSIEEFGFGAPIVARLANNMIIAGHTRWKAAAKLGLKEVPVRFLDVSEAQAKALALADNRLGEEAEWDETALRTILFEIRADVDVGILGFDEAQLADLLREELFIPEGNPQEEPEIVSECMIEIRCARSALDEFRGVLSEWSKRGDTTVNIS